MEYDLGVATNLFAGKVTTSGISCFYLAKSNLRISLKMINAMKLGKFQTRTSLIHSLLILIPNYRNTSQY